MVDPKSVNNLLPQRLLRPRSSRKVRLHFGRRRPIPTLDSYHNLPRGVDVRQGEDASFIYRSYINTNVSALFIESLQDGTRTLFNFRKEHLPLDSIPPKTSGTLLPGIDGLNLTFRHDGVSDKYPINEDFAGNNDGADVVPVGGVDYYEEALAGAGFDPAGDAVVFQFG